jgi:SAM-dependent methyltransferase
MATGGVSRRANGQYRDQCQGEPTTHVIALYARGAWLSITTETLAAWARLDLDAAEYWLRSRGGLMAQAQSTYVPALGLHWLTRFYDPVIRLTLREEAFKQSLVRQAGLAPGHAALDLGCGTGTLTLMLKHACPEAHVTGLDGDPEVLGLARQKIAASGLAVELREGLAYDLPFPPATFDRVVSSLVFHHLSDADKERAFREVHRVLKPGGECHIADWGKPENALMYLASLGIRWLDGAERTRVNLEGRLPDLMRGAGLVDVRETEQWMTLFGTLALYRGTRP